MAGRKGRLGLGDFLGSGAANFEGSLNDAPTQADIRSLPVETLIRGPYQTRRFEPDDPAIRELADSIRELGVIEPVVVRPAGGVHEILAGERRWRAAQLAGLAEIPVVVRAVDDRHAAAITLVENLQRRDLNPMEQAEGLERLRREFGLDQQQLAALLGCSQSLVSRGLGLLQLAPPVQNYLRNGALQSGHAKPLQGLPPGEQIRLADEAVRGGWSVRELERRRQRLLAARPATPASDVPDPDVARMQNRLRERLGSPVRFRFDARRGKGKIEIPFDSVEQCQGILAQLGLDPQDLED